MILYRLIKGKQNRYQKKQTNYAMIACSPCRRFTPPPPNIPSDHDHVSRKSILKIVVIELIKQ